MLFFSPPKKPKTPKWHLRSYFLDALTLILKASCGFFTNIKLISFSEKPRSRPIEKNVLVDEGETHFSGRNAAANGLDFLCLQHS